MLRVEACFFHNGSDLPWGTVGGLRMWGDSVSLWWVREAVPGYLKDKYFKFVPSDVMEGHAPRDVVKHCTCIIVVQYIPCLN